MKYWEYTEEQLRAMSTKRLLSFMRSVRKQMPTGYGPCAHGLFDDNSVPVSN